VTAAEPDDAELLARHVAGDPHAFGVLVQRHRDRLWAVALRTLGDREEAADALQDAFVSAFRRAESFRGDAAFTTWMHRIVVNACLDRVRRRKARPAEPLPDDVDRMEELGETLDEDPAAAIEQRSAVLRALRTLPEPQRSAIVLVDMEGYPVEEAARILGCAVGTIKSRCARGRAKLLPLLRHLRTPDPPGNPTGDGAVPPTSTVTMLNEQRRGGGDG
jgi:RNA polymerase sigma-70 factor (ECF subfamily)